MKKREKKLVLAKETVRGLTGGFAFTVETCETFGVTFGPENCDLPVTGFITCIE